MKIPLDIFRAALAVTAAFALAHPAEAAVFDYVYGTNSAARIYVPDTTTPLRGWMIYGNGAGSDDRGAASNSTYRRFCEENGFALMATSRFGNLSDNGEWNGLLGIMSTLAATINQPQLNHAPFLPLGMSNGGQMAYAFMYRAPERTIAFGVNKGCCYINGATNPPEAGLGIPGFFIAGGAETTLRRTNIAYAYQQGRQRGALWAWTEEVGVGHQTGQSLDWMMTYYRDIIHTRYPLTLNPTADAGVELLPMDESAGYLVSDVLDGFREGYAFADLPTGGVDTAYSWMPTLRTAQILSPVPEPATATLIAIATALIFVLRRRVRT